MRRLLLLALLWPLGVLAQTTAITTTDTVQSGCVLGAANATCQVSMKGKTSAGFIVTAVSSPSGISLVSESSRDGTSWDVHPMLDTDSGEVVDVVGNASLAVGFTRTLVLGGGVRFMRVRASAWTSGSATVAVTATDTVAQVRPEIDRSTACALGAANAACTVSLSGKNSAGFIVTAISSPNGIVLVQESSRDGTNWDAHPFMDMSTGAQISTVPNASLAVGYGKTLMLGGGDRYVRIRAAAWTSGSVTVSVVATNVAMFPPGAVDGGFSAQAVSTATALTQLVANPIVACAAAGNPYSCCTGSGAGATCQINVTSIIASASVASSTAADAHFTFKYGTGSACGTGTTTLTPLAMNAANGGFVWTLPPSSPLKVPAANALCWIHSVAGSKVINVTYFIGG
jgi:hypothetical protein